jgi:hypothetical protein
MSHRPPDTFGYALFWWTNKLRHAKFARRRVSETLVRRLYDDGTLQDAMMDELIGATR